MHSPILLLKLFLVLLQIPFLLSVHVIINILRYIAPQTTFKIALEILDELEINSWLNKEKITGVEDLKFMFSLDIMKVCNRNWAYKTNDEF
jgi:hypothetical protein